MFALFNPPKGSAKSKRRGKKRKLSGALAAYNRFRKAYKRTHKSAGAKQLKAAWRGAKGAYSHKKVAKRYAKRACVRRSAIPSITSRAIGRTVCDMAALRAARAKYCRVVGAGSGVSGLARTEAALADSNRVRSASELRTPSGARIFSVANNAGGRRPMRKRRGKKGSRRGLRLLGLNVGQALTMKGPQTTGRVTDVIKPANIMGVVPVIAGVIANSMLTGLVAGKLPMTKKGVGNYALGIAGAGVVGGIGALISPDIGAGALTGGIVEVLGRLIKDVRDRGFGALSLQGLGEDDLSGDDLEGLDDFVDPNRIARPIGVGEFVSPQALRTAMPSGPVMSQYSLPAATTAASQAQRQFQAPPGQAQAMTQAQHEAKVLAEVIADEGGW